MAKLKKIKSTDLVAGESMINLDRMVRSATAGSAGEPYCAFILEAIGLVDGSSWSLDQLAALWDDAAQSTETVGQFIERNKINHSYGWDSGEWETAAGGAP